MSYRNFLMGIMGLGLAFGLAVSAAQAGEGCCAKGAKAKGKDKGSCLMSAKELKECPLTEKRMDKTDKVVYVCPEMDYSSAKAGKCPTCDKKLKKMYCPMKEDAAKNEV